MNSYPGAFFDMHEVVMCEQLPFVEISSVGNCFLEQKIKGIPLLGFLLLAYMLTHLSLGQ